jgi:hypothetical protein
MALRIRSQAKASAVYAYSEKERGAYEALEEDEYI